MPPPMPSVVCTGFDVTHALRRYLEVGHNIDVVQALNEALAGTEEDPKDYVSATDAVMHALDRETALVESLQEHFERIIENAPAEDKEVLEIPYSYDKRLPDNWHTFLIVPTGAYAVAQYKTRAVKTPPEKDLEAIESFIECANRLLPDDAARESAGLKLEDMQYTARYPRELRPPSFIRSKLRRENRLLPRPVREFLKSVSQ